MEEAAANSSDGFPECSGVEIVWSPGSIWDTYPYHQHSSRVMQWTISGVDEARNLLIIRPVTCKGRLSSMNEAMACSACMAIPASQRFKDLESRAAQEDPHHHTVDAYLNARQLQRIMQSQRAMIRSLRTQVCSIRVYAHGPMA